MSGTRRGGEIDDYGYVEVDPTGRYGRFEDVLGRGAMKTVYRAFDELNGIEVAWNQAKICDVLRSPEALEQLYSEVHLLSTLSHDSIMQFHYSWVDSKNRTFNFIAEMFTSGSLREYRQKYKRVDIRAVKKWARQILHGLVYLHGHDPPVIHRDLKCDNIFINGNLGQVKIGDFGLAAVLQDSQPARSVIGTPEFMAPELYDEEYNELVDIYSFGMCVFEMLTAEYPYSECSNPAQIYKKVTSGKLPGAFYKIQGREAQRFIGRCLEKASTRCSADELLLDPFLQVEDVDTMPTFHGEIFNAGSGSTSPCSQVDHHHLKVMTNTEMKITGKLNPDDDAIILRVQFSNKDGHASNIYFPFDIINDTPIDVANEMVKELEITYCDPCQIAEMIDREISALVPDWKERKHMDGHDYTDGYSDDEEGFSHHHFYTSSSTSSQSSWFSQVQSYRNTHDNHNFARHAQDWLQDHGMLFTKDDDDDETSSESSIQSDKISYVDCNVGSEPEPMQSPRRRDPQFLSHNQKASRFGPEEKKKNNNNHLTDKLFLNQCAVSSDSSQPSSCNGTRRSSSNKALVRNRSLVDIRSQLLHRTLVEEVNKRLFKTVGTMEDIGFQHPCETSSGKVKKSSSRHVGNTKNLGLTWNEQY